MKTEHTERYKRNRIVQRLGYLVMFGWLVFQPTHTGDDYLRQAGAALLGCIAWTVFVGMLDLAGILMAAAANVKSKGKRDD